MPRRVAMLKKLHQRYKKRSKNEATEQPAKSDSTPAKNSAVEVESDTKDLSVSEAQLNKRSPISRLKKIAFGSKKRIIVSSVVVSIFALSAGAYALPTTRFVILNTISQANAEITVINAITKLPVSGAKVTTRSGASAVTDTTGKARIDKIDFGKTDITITRTNYKDESFSANITKKESDLGTHEISPTGVPINLKAIDWLSEENLTSFSAVIQNDQSTRVDAADGMLTLSVPYEATEALITVNAEGYNEFQVKVDMNGADINREPTNNDEVTVITAKLVIFGEHYFISNRDGTIGFYESMYDGGHIEKVVATNQKDSYLEYYTIPDTEKYVALLSSTGKIVNGRQDQLAIINIEDKSLKIIDEAPNQKLDFSIISVSDKNIVYQVSYDSERADQFKIKSYSFETGKLTTHYSSNSYLSPTFDEDRSSIYIVKQDAEYTGLAGSTFKILKINLSNNQQSSLFERQAVSFISIPPEKPDKLLVSVYDAYFNTVQSGYYLMDLSDNSKIEYLGTDWPDLGEPDEIPDSEKGQASPNGSNRIWISYRDDRARLILNETSQVISGQSEKLSVDNIIRWVNDRYVAVKASEGTQSSDYIIDTKTGNYQKITDSLSSYYGGYGY